MIRLRKFLRCYCDKRRANLNQVHHPKLYFYLLSLFCQSTTLNIYEMF